MTRLRVILQEAWRSVTASMSTSVAATMTVLVGMFVLGLTIALGTWVLSWSHHVKSELLVKVYFAQDASPKQIDAVRIKLANDPRVKTVTFVSKGDALKRMQKTYPQLFKTKLPSNPLPASDVVTPTNGSYTEQLGGELTRANLPGVDDVRWGGKTAHRVLTIAEVIWVIALGAIAQVVRDTGATVN